MSNISTIPCWAVGLPTFGREWSTIQCTGRVAIFIYFVWGKNVNQQKPTILNNIIPYSAMWLPSLGTRSTGLPTSYDENWYSKNWGKRTIPEVRAIDANAELGAPSENSRRSRSCKCLCPASVAIVEIIVIFMPILLDLIGILPCRCLHLAPRHPRRYLLPDMSRSSAGHSNSAWPGGRRHYSDTEPWWLFRRTGASQGGQTNSEYYSHAAGRWMSDIGSRIVHPTNWWPQWTSWKRLRGWEPLSIAQLHGLSNQSVWNGKCKRR